MSRAELPAWGVSCCGKVGYVLLSAPALGGVKLTGQEFKPHIAPMLLWQDGLFDTLVEVSAPMPEPVRTFAFRRAVEEVEFRVKTSGRDIVTAKDLLSTTRVAISRSMYRALKRNLEKNSIPGADGLDDDIE